MSNSLIRKACWFSLWALGNATTCAYAIDPLPLQLQWNVDPKLDVRWHHVDDPPRLDVDRNHFASPLAEKRLFAAQSTLRFLHHPKLDRNDVANAMLARLEQGEPNETVRKAMVSALCAVGDAAQAKEVWKIAQKYPDVALLVEQGLVRWKAKDAIDVWKQRLERKSAGRLDDELVVACSGVGAARDSTCLDLLTAIVEDIAQPDIVRLEAAKAIDSIDSNDRLDLAMRLRKTKTNLSDLIAVSLVANQSQELGQERLIEFMSNMYSDGSQNAQRLAFDWLCRYDTSAAQAKAIEVLGKADSEIRRRAIQIVSSNDNPHQFRTLVKALNDINPELRQLAREYLLKFASTSPENEASVKDMVGVALGLPHWRAKEQCIRLAVELGESQHAGRILELLDHPEPDLALTAAWGLKHLGKDNAVLAKMLEHAEKWSTNLNEQPALRVAHLLEAFGMRRYRPAQELLLRCVPRAQGDYHMVNRISGTWAAGRMWEHESNPNLTRLLLQRITDKNNQNPEFESIRYASTLALGFVADPSTRDTIDAMDEPGQPIGTATEWALRRIDERKPSEK